jgi:hypothetical protein
MAREGVPVMFAPAARSAYWAVGATMRGRNARTRTASLHSSACDTGSWWHSSQSQRAIGRPAHACCRGSQPQILRDQLGAGGGEGRFSKVVHHRHRQIERLAPDSEGAMRKGQYTEEQMVVIIREADRDQVSSVANRSETLRRLSGGRRSTP